jgi:LuxR family maltose regulon positive regulatory protein
VLSDVLATKLHPPLATNRLVPRPELLARFISGLEFPLTLVCAPAGFGKTTLVAQWLAGQEVPVAWLSIDEQDSDPLRFFTYFVHALQSVAPVGESVLQSLDAGSGSIGPAMTSLINELDTHERKLILVLDDYHELDSHEIDAALEMLVNRMPRSLRLVMTSR